MGRRYDTVSLLTDYGLDDEFVGVLKAVIRELAPHVTTIDLTHGIRPFDVRAGALALARAIPYLPEGVVVAVVDPGVATARRAIAVEVAAGAGVLVGPDNGLLAPAVGVVDGADRAVELTDPAYHLPGAPGATFAGRDIFASVAAHLCNGVDLDDLGPAVDPALLTPGLVPLPRLEPDGLHAEVLWVDRFGNCQLNVGPAELEQVGEDTDVVAIVVGDDRRAARSARAFAELGPGAIGLVLDSHGMYALALDQRSAAAELGLVAGDAVRISPVDDEARPSASAGRAVTFRRASRPDGPPIA
jgi:S-adenosyl-L-methionine hydrolase (adenosine-forming)